MMDPTGQLTLEQQQLLNQMHNHAAFQHQMDSQSMATTTCIYCSTQLSYPHNSIFIQCPKCSNTMNPQAPQTNYMNCIGCGTLLSHPPSSLTIQCPKCLMIMNLQSVRNNNPTPNTNPLPNDPSHDPPSSQPDDNHSDDGSNNKKSRKKRKDPNAPKRASNAYMIFCKERRAQLKEDRPDLQFGKLGARLGEIWRQMSADEKKPYENRASSDRERYKKEMNSYQAHSMIKQQAGHMGTPGEDEDQDEGGSEEEVEEQSGEPTKRRKHSHQESDPGQYQPQSQQPQQPNLDERTLAQFQYNLMAHDPLLQQTMALQLQQQQQQLQHLSYAYQQQQQQQLQHQLQQHVGNE